MKKILIADDHEIIIRGLTQFLNIPEKIYHVIGVSNLISLKATLTQENNDFDLIILDIKLSGGNTLHFIENLKRQDINIPIIIFSAYEESIMAPTYIAAGVDGYVEKNENMHVIKQAIQTVLAGNKYVSKKLIDQIITNKFSPVNKVGVEILSKRELEISRLLAQGMGIKAISEQLFLSSSAVGTYKKRIFEKLHINSTIELVKYFEL